jgi:hypothetical protein
MLVACMVVALLASAARATDLDRATRRHHGVRQVLRVKAGAGPEDGKSLAAKVCGPKALSGRVHFSDWKAILPWSGLRTGTTCTRVSFGRHAFPASRDIYLLLTPDRIDASSEPHSPPLAWAESLTSSGFLACIHMPVVDGQRTSLTKDRVAVSWVAVNRFTALTKKFIDGHQVQFDLPDDTVRCSGSIPNTLDADEHVILTSAVHPGIRYENPYTSIGQYHLALEAAATWVQPSNSTSAKHEICVQRPLERVTENLEAVRLTVMGFKREKRVSGLAKIDVTKGRRCTLVAVAAPLDARALKKSQIQVSVRLHENDGTPSLARGPTVTAWVGERSDEGFTICAEAVQTTRARGGAPPAARNESRREAPVERRLWNSVQVSWMAVRNIDKPEEYCQTVPSK